MLNEEGTALMQDWKAHFSLGLMLLILNCLVGQTTTTTKPQHIYTLPHIQTHILLIQATCRSHVLLHIDISLVRKFFRPICVNQCYCEIARKATLSRIALPSDRMQRPVYGILPQQSTIQGQKIVNHFICYYILPAQGAIWILCLNQQNL